MGREGGGNSPHNLPQAVGVGLLGHQLFQEGRLEDLGQQRERGDQHHHGDGALGGRDVRKDVLVLLDEPERLPKCYLADQVERQKLRLACKVDGPVLCRRRNILGFDQFDQARDDLVDRLLQVGVFFAGILF